jgi:hypothetical protein
MPSMNIARPIPLRPDPGALRRAAVNTVTRSATALVLACERPDAPRQDPVKLAADLFPGDRDVGLLTRAAVTPTTTTSAASLLSTLTEYFLESLSGVWASATLLEETLQLSFDGAAVISVPAFVADATGAGFVGEGAPIPARSLVASALSLDPSKLAVIVGLSNEVVSAAAGNAEAMVSDVLTRSVGLALDSALFDANPAVPEVRPAGLRNGIAALTASAATNATDAMIADVGKVAGAVAAVAGNSPIILVANPARALTLKLRAPRELPLTVLASSAIAAGDLIAVAPNAIVSATDSAPQISVARETVLHMDTAPSNISTVGTPNVVAVPTVSYFQTDCVALRCRMFATWAKRDSRAVAWLTATAW